MKNYKLIFVLFFILTSCKEDSCGENNDCPPIIYHSIFKIVNTEGENLYDISDNEYIKESLEVKGINGDEEFKIYHTFDNSNNTFSFNLSSKIVIKYNENTSDTLFFLKSNLKLLDGTVLCGENDCPDKFNVNLDRFNVRFYEIIKE